VEVEGAQGQTVTSLCPEVKDCVDSTQLKLGSHLLSPEQVLYSTCLSTQLDFPDRIGAWILGE
jgi:hypothetical protein